MLLEYSIRFHQTMQLYKTGDHYWMMTDICCSTCPKLILFRRQAWFNRVRGLQLFSVWKCFNGIL